MIGISMAWWALPEGMGPVCPPTYATITMGVTTMCMRRLSIYWGSMLGTGLADIVIWWVPSAAIVSWSAWAGTSQTLVAVVVSRMWWYYALPPNSCPGMSSIHWWSGIYSWYVPGFQIWAHYPPTLLSTPSDSVHGLSISNTERMIVIAVVSWIRMQCGALPLVPCSSAGSSSTHSMILLSYAIVSMWTCLISVTSILYTLAFILTIILIPFYLKTRMAVMAASLYLGQVGGCLPLMEDLAISLLLIICHSTISLYYLTSPILWPGCADFILVSTCMTHLYHFI